MIQACLLLVLIPAFLQEAPAWWEYTVSGSDCVTCHGEFLSSPYISLTDSQSWGDSLHNVHIAQMVSGDCDVCHTSAGNLPVRLNRSAGGTGMEALSCSGCHGRPQDGWVQEIWIPGYTMGFSFGLRRQHWQANTMVNGISTRICRTCHPDSDMVAEPASEWLLPPYYANPGTGHPDIPTSPCDTGTGGENFAGGPSGLDNDGDGLFDGADPDCAPGPGTPGEASGWGQPLVTVSGYDPNTGILSITYAPACGAADHDIYGGPLRDVRIYGWGGQVCGIGASGTYAFNPGSGSYFFLVIGNNGTAEGSYGHRMRENYMVHERPSWAGNGCGRTQDLSKRCD